jgi:hypothetical protein
LLIPNPILRAAFERADRETTNAASLPASEPVSRFCLDPLPGKAVQP